MLILFLILLSYHKENTTSDTNQYQLRVYLNDPLSTHEVFHKLSLLFPKIEVRSLVSFSKTARSFERTLEEEENNTNSWLERAIDNLEENLQLEKKVSKTLIEHKLRLEFDPVVSAIAEKEKVMTENFRQFYGQVWPVAFCAYLGFSEFELPFEFLDALTNVGVPAKVKLRCNNCVFVLESLGESREYSEVTLSFIGEEMKFVSVVRYWLKEVLQLLEE